MLIQFVSLRVLEKTQKFVPKKKNASTHNLIDRFDDGPQFTVTLPEKYPNADRDAHLFVFTESAQLSGSWLMRVSDFCERKTTRTLQQFFTKAVATYLEETDVMFRNKALLFSFSLLLNDFYFQKGDNNDDDGIFDEDDEANADDDDNDDNEMASPAKSKNKTPSKKGKNNKELLNNIVCSDVENNNNNLLNQLLKTMVSVTVVISVYKVLNSWNRWKSLPKRNVGYHCQLERETREKII